MSLAGQLPAQAVASPPKKPEPPKIDKHILVFPESVVTDQWPHTLSLVNPPQNLALLNPGECVRIGIAATGDDRDAYIAKTQLSFRVEFAGRTENHPLAALGAMKQIKPEGGDFVTAALNAANVQNPLLTLASLGVSAAGWCVPDDAQDGTATIEAEIESPGGKQKLARLEIPVESFDIGGKRTFKDDHEASDFLMNYHYQPEPARLLPSLQSLAAGNALRSKQENILSSATTFAAALKENPDAAKDFMAKISTQTGFTRVFGLLALVNAGYDIAPALKTMSDNEQKMFANHPVLPDPYDFSHPEDLGTRLDMLWGAFMTTGQFAPIQKITTALAWRSDWDEFDKARKSANPPKEWTPAIGRAVAYKAAGWSLSSFQRNDPLAADYIEFMIAAPDTPAEVRTELKGLDTNPAFRRTGN